MQNGQLIEGEQQDQRSTTTLVHVWLYRFLMVAVMMGGIAGLNLAPLRFPSAAAWGASALYAVVLVYMQRVYRACELGQARVSELVMSQMLANMVAGVLFYFGVALYVHHLFVPWFLLMVLATQLLLGCCWSVWANRIYFRNRRPLRTAVICRDEASLAKLYTTPYFHMKYDVCKQILNPDHDIAAIRKEIEGCEAVFTVGIPASLTNGVAKLCLEMDIKGYFVPHLGHIIMAGAEYMSTFSIPVLRVQRAGHPSEYRAMKRLMDICLSLVGIVATAPIMAVTAIAIKAEDRGPVFYRQVRLTKNGEEFRIIKFRSMRVNAEADGVARLAGENDNRITRVGRLIRACRVDELPQLFNILAGTMSVVGPRPERPEIAAEYRQELPEFAFRLQVKAGLTGLAQIYGRYNTDPYSKLQMDLMYINEMSFLTDMQLIFATVKILFMKESTQGVAVGQATALEQTAKDEDLSA